jgi:hypothetical protein
VIKYLLSGSVSILRVRFLSRLELGLSLPSVIVSYISYSVLFGRVVVGVKKKLILDLTSLRDKLYRLAVVYNRSVR